MVPAAAAMATAASADVPPLSGPRGRARRCNRGAIVRCAAVAGGAAEAPASAGARASADCVVVGGGISGLCTAQALATKHGIGDVLVTEARARPGGNITTVERPEEGYLWEEGPNSFQPSDPVLTMAVRSSLAPTPTRFFFFFFSDPLRRREMLNGLGLGARAQVDSGLKDDLVFGDPNAPRFVLWEGKLRPVPSKPADLPFFDLMSIPGKLRAGFGALGIRPPPPVRALPVLHS